LEEKNSKFPEKNNVQTELENSNNIQRNSSNEDNDFSSLEELYLFWKMCGGDVEKELLSDIVCPFSLAFKTRWKY
jgi:hypothetical protein